MSSSTHTPFFFAYATEGLALVGEGVPALAVEQAGRVLGFSLGPLAALDEASLKPLDDALHQELHDLEQHAQGHRDHDQQQHSHDHDHDHDHQHDHGHAHKNHDVAQTAQAHRHKVKSKLMPESAVYVLEKMAHGFRRGGKAAGAGFYDYTTPGDAVLWSGLKTFERGARRPPDADADVQDRLAYAAALGALRQQVLPGRGTATAPTVTDASAEQRTNDAHAALDLVDRVGLPRFIERARELAQQYGERFTPPASLAAAHAEPDPSAA